jgi:hypothetical protein
VTLGDLTIALVEASMRVSGGAPVMVAGHGAVHMVTHAYIENGSQVLLLYVEADAGSTRGVPGDPQELAPQADRAGTLPEVRGAEPRAGNEPVALPDVPGAPPPGTTRTR